MDMGADAAPLRIGLEGDEARLVDQHRLVTAVVGRAHRLDRVTGMRLEVVDQAGHRTALVRPLRMIDDLGGEFGLADRLAAVEAGLTCADGHRLQLAWCMPAYSQRSQELIQRLYVLDFHWHSDLVFHGIWILIIIY